MDFTDSDDTQAPEYSQFLETQLDFSCPPQFAPECNTFKWKVQIRAVQRADRVASCLRSSCLRAEVEQAEIV
ncbi:hypothetical protein F2Q69_00014485 [Brassica cretica]|uniref:Uncharacterized protein n=1 Tax=Brassica cretica TaxID=69181 RepID=A0A8S9R218_BRACR|nr:hypothetical protein F2Q69_00014485 [Brassica cretica]